MDKPGGRKLHTGNIPIIGGLAMFIGLSVGILLLGVEQNLFLSILVASLLLVVVGVIDDRMALHPVAKITTQVAVVLVMIYGVDLKLTDMGNLFGSGVIATGNFMLIFTMLATITVINAYNLIDGVDGLAGSLARGNAGVKIIQCPVPVPPPRGQVMVLCGRGQVYPLSLIFDGGRGLPEGGIKGRPDPFHDNSTKLASGVAINSVEPVSRWRQRLIVLSANDCSAQNTSWDWPLCEN